MRLAIGSDGAGLAPEQMRARPMEGERIGADGPRTFSWTRGGGRWVINLRARYATAEGLPRQAALIRSVIRSATNTP
jgi:hypothetical protein